MRRTHGQHSTLEFHSHPTSESLLATMTDSRSCKLPCQSIHNGFQVALCILTPMPAASYILSYYSNEKLLTRGGTNELTIWAPKWLRRAFLQHNHFCSVFTNNQTKKQAWLAIHIPTSKQMGCHDNTRTDCPGEEMPRHLPVMPTRNTDKTTQKCPLQVMFLKNSGQKHRRALCQWHDVWCAVANSPFPSILHISQLQWRPMKDSLLLQQWKITLSITHFIAHFCKDTCKHCRSM